MQLQDFKSRASRTLKRVLRIVLIVVVVAGIALFSFYYWGVYDEGVRAGTVLRISKKGILFKTYEGQLNLETFGALRGANPIMEAFDFSVEPSEKQLIEELQQVEIGRASCRERGEARVVALCT